jgi:hypothetical protein
LVFRPIKRAGEDQSALFKSGFVGLSCHERDTYHNLACGSARLGASFDIQTIRAYLQLQSGALSARIAIIDSEEFLLYP